MAEREPRARLIPLHERVRTLEGREERRERCVAEAGTADDQERRARIIVAAKRDPLRHAVDVHEHTFFDSGSRRHFRLLRVLGYGKMLRPALRTQGGPQFGVDAKRWRRGPSSALRARRVGAYGCG